MRVSTARTRRRTAGRLGRGGGPGSGGGATLFSPEPQVLQEGEGEPAQERVVVQAAPGAALEVVEPQLLLELLVRLLAHPARLDQRRQLLQGRVRREVREVVLGRGHGLSLIRGAPSRNSTPAASKALRMAASLSRLSMPWRAS